jgi:hypothetical protein
MRFLVAWSTVKLICCGLFGSIDPVKTHAVGTSMSLASLCVQLWGTPTHAARADHGAVPAPYCMLHKEDISPGPVFLQCHEWCTITTNTVSPCRAQLVLG